MVDNVGLTETPSAVDATPVHARSASRPIVLVHADDIKADQRRGGQIRTLLSPRNAGSVSGFMGLATLAPGERIAEHYHPYSEEFLFLVEGQLVVDLDGEPWAMAPGHALLVPPGTRHRLRNVGSEPVRCVFHLGPLAPRPDLGHVDTEQSTMSEETR